MLGERVCPSSGHDDVIERPNIDQLERFFDGLGQHMIGFAWIGLPAGVVMNQHGADDIGAKCRLADFARIDRTLSQRPVKENVVPGSTVTRPDG